MAYPLDASLLLRDSFVFLDSWVNFLIFDFEGLLVLLVFFLTFEPDHIVSFQLEFIKQLLLGRSEATLQILVQGKRDFVLNILSNYVVAFILRGLNWLEIFLTVFVRQLGLSRIRLPLILRGLFGVHVRTFFVFF